MEVDRVADAVESLVKKRYPRTEAQKEARKNYLLSNPLTEAQRELVKQYKHNYYMKNQQQNKLKWQHHYLKNKKQDNLKSKNYRRKNKDKIKKLAQSVSSKARMRQRYRLMCQNNPEFKAAKLCRSRFACWMKACGGIKSAHTETLVGCSWSKLVIHLNNNILGLKVGQSGVHIDHIRPVASFTLYNDPVQQRECMNFNNLQLLYAHDNMAKHASYNAEEYALSPAGQAIALLRVEWELEFPVWTSPVDCETEKDEQVDCNGNADLIENWTPWEAELLHSSYWGLSDDDE
jgi:hypothetical protein